MGRRIGKGLFKNWATEDCDNMLSLLTAKIGYYLGYIIGVWQTGNFLLPI